MTVMLVEQDVHANLTISFYCVVFDGSQVLTVVARSNVFNFMRMHG